MRFLIIHLNILNFTMEIGSSQGEKINLITAMVNGGSIPSAVAHKKKNRGNPQNHKPMTKQNAVSEIQSSFKTMFSDVQCSFGSIFSREDVHQMLNNMETKVLLLIEQIEVSENKSTPKFEITEHFKSFIENSINDAISNIEEESLFDRDDVELELYGNEISVNRVGFDSYYIERQIKDSIMSDLRDYEVEEEEDENDSDDTNSNN